MSTQWNMKIIFIYVVTKRSSHLYNKSGICVSVQVVYVDSGKKVFIFRFISDKQDFSIHIDDIFCNIPTEPIFDVSLQFSLCMFIINTYTRVSFQFFLLSIT